jgi:hypothetical protein
MYRVMTGDYRRAKERRPDIPQELDDVIASTMALDPAMRPPGAAQLEQTLLAFCRPAFRDNMLQRISSAGIVFGTSPPQRQSRPAQDPLRSGFGTNPAATPLTGTDPTLLAPSGITPAPPKKKSIVPFVVAGILLVGGGAGAFIAMQSKQQTKPLETEEPGPSPAPAPAPPVAVEPPAAPPAETVTAPPAPPAPATVTLKFSVEPKTASIEVDGVRVTGAEVTVDKDEAEHTLSVTAPGFKPHDEALRFDESQKIVIRLDKAPKHTTPVRPKPPKQETKHERIESESPYK